MRHLLAICLLFSFTTASAKLDLTHVVPMCHMDIETLPIRLLEVVNEEVDVAGNQAIYSITGTVFLVDDNTWMTAAHIIDDHAIVINTHNADGSRTPLTIIKSIPEMDLVVLSGDSTGLTPIMVDDRLPIEELVYNIGYPGFAGDVLVSYAGIITGTTETKIQTNAAVFSGMSGGPVLWCDGDVLTAFGAIHAFGLGTEHVSVVTTTGIRVITITRNNGYSYVIPAIANVLNVVKGEQE